MKLRSNLRKHEVIGLILVFLSWTSLGYGLYILLWAVNRATILGGPEHLLHGKELLVVPLFFGTAAVLNELGRVELKEACPGKHRR